MIFVIGDIHGCCKELYELLHDKIKFGPEDTLIFLGDYIDRGEENKSVLDLLIRLKHNHKNSIFLRGNHEQMLLDFIENPSAGDIWLYNGGYKTLEEFKADSGYDIPDEYVKFLESTRFYFQDNDYFFCHAGVPNKELSKITAADYQDLLWIRDEFLNNQMMWEKKIIHGHTPEKEVEFKDNRINIDTGCVFAGKLTCLELPSEKIYQVENKPKGF